MHGLPEHGLQTLSHCLPTFHFPRGTLAMPTFESVEDSLRERIGLAGQYQLTEGTGPNHVTVVTVTAMAMVSINLFCDTPPPYPQFLSKVL